MKLWVESPYNRTGVLRKLKRLGFATSRRSPDFVLTYGGDGSILLAEAKHPGVPKIPVRRSLICRKCAYYHASDLESTLRKLKQRKYRIVRAEKVEALFKGKKITALNEIQVRNKDPRHALRFVVSIGRERHSVIADGLIASTPYGSTAYYKSLGYEPFSRGIRIGLNNPVSRRKYFSVRKEALVEITRERAQLVGDNQKKIYRLRKGDIVIIRKAKGRACFVNFR